MTLYSLIYPCLLLLQMWTELQPMESCMALASCAGKMACKESGTEVSSSCLPNVECFPCYLFVTVAFPAVHGIKLSG